MIRFGCTEINRRAAATKMFVVLRFIMLAAMREEGGLGRRHGGARGLVRRTLRGRR